MNHLPPSLYKYLGHFEYFRKFADIFSSQDFATGVNYTDGKFAPVSMTLALNFAIGTTGVA